MTAAWRDRVLDEARTWLRTPWHHNARVRGAGVDCGHLLAACYIGAGLAPDIDLGQYTADWMQHQSEERFLSFVRQYMDPVDAPQPADVAVWQYGHCFSHGGIVVDWPRVIHAHAHEGAVVYGDADRGALARMHLPAGGSAPRPVLFFSRAGRLPA